jgi:hypothetical protein
MGQQTTNDGVLTKASSLDGQVFLFQVSSIGTVDYPELAFRLYSQDEISPGFHDTIRQNLSFFLSLDDDLRPFYALAEEDPSFEPVMKELYGHHQVKFSMSAFENDGRDVPPEVPEVMHNSVTSVNVTTATMSDWWLLRPTMIRPTFFI